MPRDLLVRTIRFPTRIYRFPPSSKPLVRARYSARAPSPTGSVSAGLVAEASLDGAHASQASADGGADRTSAAFLGIPRPVFDLVFGREWYVDASRPAGAGVAHDVFG